MKSIFKFTFGHQQFWVLALCLLLCGGAVAQEHTLNLQDVEIRALTATVAEITGKNFVLDPKVSGNVTVISANPMDEEQVYQVFLSVLQVHGYTAVPDAEVIKIVPDITARQIGSSGEGGRTVVTKVLSVSSGSATELVAILRPLLPPQAHIVAHEPSNTLIVADRAENVARMEQLLQRIDRTAGGEVEALTLQYANAAELARTINQLYGDGAQIAVADERTNTLLLKTDATRRLKLRALITHLDTPLDTGGATQVTYLKYAQASDLVGILEKSLAAMSGGENAATTTIQAYDETNALVITAPSAISKALQSVVRQLDVRRAQVMVEGIIAEVSEETVKELGVQWQALSSLDLIRDADGNIIDIDGGAFGGTNFGGRGSGVNILDLATNPTAAARGLNIGYLSGATSIFGAEVLQLGAVLRALAADTDTNVLSTPSVVTLDHQEAEIFIGQQVPFLTGQFTNTGAAQGSLNPFQTINRQDVGLKLNVTPHINDGDAVVLEISQEVSSLVQSQLAVDLITNKRELTTTVMVPDNTILVLGGLITDDLIESVERVPGLSKVPLLGELFKYRNTSKTKRNLMLFIRPRILRDDALQQDLSAARYQFLRAEQIKARETADGLTAEQDMPLLPELFDYLQTPVPPQDPE